MTSSMKSDSAEISFKKPSCYRPRRYTVIYVDFFLNRTGEKKINFENISPDLLISAFPSC